MARNSLLVSGEMEPQSVDRMFAFLRANLRARAVIATLRRWQLMEKQTLSEVGHLVEHTPNPFVRVVLEIIRHDSLVHHRVQQCLIDSLADSDPMPSRVVLARLVEDLAGREPELEEALRLAAELEPLTSSPRHRALLDYLVEDTRRQMRLLSQLRELIGEP